MKNIIAFIFSIIVLTSCSDERCVTGNVQEVSYSYSAKVQNLNLSMNDYYDIAQRKTLIERAENYERTGKKSAGKAVRVRLGLAEKEFDSLLPEERTALKNIWSRAQDAKMPGDLYFNSVSVGGSAMHVVTAVTPNGVPSSLREGETIYADTVIDDVCTLTNVTYLCLRYLSLRPESLKKLTRMKNLEYLDAPVNITDESLVMMLRELPSLKYLELWGCTKITGLFSLDKKALQNLCEIKIIGAALDSSNLAEIITLPCVKFIGLDGMNLYIDGNSRARSRLTSR